MMRKEWNGRFKTVGLDLWTDWPDWITLRGWRECNWQEFNLLHVYFERTGMRYTGGGEVVVALFGFGIRINWCDSRAQILSEVTDRRLDYLAQGLHDPEDA